jgi:UDP-N-acetylmuramoyl-L-alanyl-D-glutamate--2,6-diaminopimelate ligase
MQVQITPKDDIEVSSLAYDSRQVERGALFFAVKGLTTDGNLFVDQAVSRGAAAIASEQPPSLPSPVIAWIQSRSSRRLMAHAANRFYGEPSRQLSMIGITGTNGKTTTAHLCYSILQRHSQAVMLGSIETRVGNQKLESTLTTPEAIDVQRILRLALEQGCKFGVMEASSHALFFDRVFQAHFPVSIFTNLSQDHLDFHSGLEDYFSAKTLLFRHSYNPGIRWALLNIDDPFGQRLAREVDGEVITFGLTEEACIHPLEYTMSPEGLEANLGFFGKTLRIRSPLVGCHNLYNLMAAAGACSLLGVQDGTIQSALEELRNVLGRFETVSAEVPFSIIIDFAHTPDALKNVIELARQVAERRVICLFGCGGDRDRGKRPQMGAIACRGADVVVVTSDNPRSEDPQEIIDEILSGIPDDQTELKVIPDRKAAIRRALEIAQPGDLVLLAGKGHETYQEIDGKKFPFDEREIVRKVLCSN